MDEVETFSIALSPDMAAALRAAVDAGDYDSVEEAVNGALRDWRARRGADASGVEELRRLVQEGMDSGPGRDADEVFARLRAEYPDASAA